MWRYQEEIDSLHIKKKRAKCNERSGCQNLIVMELCKINEQLGKPIAIGSVLTCNKIANIPKMQDVL